MIITRLAEDNDLDVIIELIHLKAAFDGFPDSVTATRDSLHEGLFGKSPEAQVLLAEMDQDVVGMASFHKHYSTFIAKPGIWLDDLFVRSEHRGRGAGQALMVQLAKICLERGGGRIEWSTAARNSLGIKFYERIGSVILDGSRLTRLGGAELIRLASHGEE